ncbi:MAG: hypothetical protein NC328_04530 [Muribaculum sp.]|nr:hypothetical protein [Muribaculum sp.]
MSKTTFNIIYTNEDDRAYGLAGMAISIASLDAMDRISEVSLDAEGPMVTFSHDFYFSGSPSVSPKATWNNLIRNFHLTTSMVIGNLMARSLVRLGTEVPVEAMTRVRDAVVEEGRDSCALEEDESTRLLQRAVMRANRIFMNPRIHPAVKELAAEISRRRRLSGRELEELLSLLQF